MVFTFKIRPFHSSYSFLPRYFEDQQNIWHFVISQYFFNQIGFLSELFWNSVYHPFKTFISIIRNNSRFYPSSIKIGASQKKLPLISSKSLTSFQSSSHEFLSCFFLNFEKCVSWISLGWKYEILYGIYLYVTSHVVSADVQPGVLFCSI